MVTTATVITTVTVTTAAITTAGAGDPAPANTPEDLRVLRLTFYWLHHRLHQLLLLGFDFHTPAGGDILCS